MSNLIKIDLNKPLIFLDNVTPVMENDGRGNPTDKTINLSKILANALSSISEGGLKYFHWALSLYQTGNLELDKVDFDTFKAAVDKLQLNNLIKGRIQEFIKLSETSNDATNN